MSKRVKQEKNTKFHTVIILSDNYHLPRLAAIPTRVCAVIRTINETMRTNKKNNMSDKVMPSSPLSFDMSRNEFLSWQILA